MRRSQRRTHWSVMAAVLITAAASGCSSYQRASFPPGEAALSVLGALAIAIAHAPSYFMEFVRSGAYEVVRPGADFEEWRMRYAH